MARCVLCHRASQTTNAPCAACAAGFSWEPDAEVSWDKDGKVRADSQASGGRSSQVELPPTLLGKRLPSLSTLKPLFTPSAGSQPPGTPGDLLQGILAHLEPGQQAVLRRVCKHLADILEAVMTRVTIHQDLPRKAAVSLRQRFPKLSSLGFIQPSSTQYLQLLQGLTRVCFASSQPGSRGALIRVDLAPLRHLRNLHTLHLEQVQIQRLSRSPACAMAGLTQLQALHLVDCSCPVDPMRHSQPALRSHRTWLHCEA